MKITLEQAVLGYNALQRIGSEKLPIKLAYTLQRNMRILKPDASQFEEQRMELIKTKYGQKDNAGNYIIPSEKMSAFTKQMDSLGSVELELDLHTVNIDEVNMQIAPNDLFSLEWMFVIESPEVPKTTRKKK